MGRLKHLFVAIATLGLGVYCLRTQSENATAGIHQAADDRVKGAPAAVASALAADAQSLLGQVRGLPLLSIADAMDDEGKPTAEALETARNGFERNLSAEAERPAVVVVSAQGVAGRYHQGQSNRFDKDLSAFPTLAESGPMPRAGIGSIDGEVRRFVTMQFSNTKAENTKGTLIFAFALDDGLARRLAVATDGLDVTLTEDGKSVGTTLPPNDRQTLLAGLGNNLASAKGSQDIGAATGQAFSLMGLPLPMFITPARYRVAMLPPVPGLPANFRVVVSTRTLERYASLAEEQRTVIGVFLALCLLSLVFVLFSGNPANGLSRVVSAAEKLAQGDRNARAPTDKMSTLVRRAAVAINSLAGQLGAPQPATGNALSFAEQLGIKNRPSTQPPPPAATEPPAKAPASEPPPAPADAFKPEGEVDSFLSGVPSGGPSPASALANAVTRVNVAAFNPPPAAAPADAFELKPKASQIPMYERPASDDEFSHDETVIARTPEALIRATQRSTAMASPSSAPPASAGAVPLPPPAANSDELHYQQVFKEFVATREQCNEAADGLTFDKFVQKLRKNQEQLVQKYQCRTVRFQVYVKDGKAALKATPVR